MIPIALSLIDNISSIRIHIPKDLRSAESRTTVQKSLAAIATRFPDGLPLLDPIEDMRISDDDFVKLIKVRCVRRW